MKLVLTLLLIISFLITVYSQEDREEIKGVVTYITSQNVYVQFSSAKKIKVGDQLYRKENDTLKPASTVEQRSSVSCVGKAIGDFSPKVGDVLFALIPIEKEEPKIEGTVVETPIRDATIHKDDEQKDQSSKPEQKIRGRLLFSSYSNMSNLEIDDNYKFRYTYSLNIANIANSRFTLDNYISFTHKSKRWDDIQENIFKGLKIYSLNLNYKAGKNTNLSVGRKINPKISSIGAIDGVQVESGIKNFYYGGVAGFRPDYVDYSFNFDLLEYGAFVGHTVRTKTGRMQTSLAIFEQTNSGKIDRRFAYFQHDNTLIKKISFFISSELDLYRLQDNQPVTNLFLTSLYTSVRYRPVKKFSVMCSYDNRKNIIYYETFKSYIDKLLQDATRKGFQLRLNYKPLPKMNVIVSSSYRLRDNDIRPTRNLNGNMIYSSLPWINASASLSANLLENSYLSGKVFGLRLTRDFMKGMLNGGFSYRYVDYVFVNNDKKLNQNIGEIDLTYRFNKKLSVSANYEGTFENETRYHHVYLNFIKRF